VENPSEKRVRFGRFLDRFDKMFQEEELMPHDCLFCKLTRGLFLAGMLALAGILLIAVVDNACHAKWLLAGKELVGIFIPLFGAWFGLRILRAMSVAFDRSWPDEE
jgi:hypothetical protein